MADLTVTAEIAAAARKGLELHAAGKSGDGLVSATVRDARRMADREALSEEKVRRMPGWFARHASDKVPGWDEPGEETPGYVAWLLWGGDAAQAWAERKVEELDAEAEDREVRGPDDPPVLITDIDGTLFDGDTPRQTVIDYVNDFDAGVIIVTARYIGTRDATIEQLRGVVRYDQLIMRDEDEPEDVYKERVGKAMMDRFNVLQAIDNDEAARAAYERIGIRAINPDDITSSDDDLLDTDQDDIRGFTIGKVLLVDTKFEHRFVDVSDIEVRDGATGDGMSFRGYAAVFNSWSENLGGFRERIRPGAFSRSLKSRNEIRMYLNHNTDMVLASRRAGTLRLSEDERGLRVDADLPDTTYGRDLSVLMRRGDVNSMSFGFSVPPKGDAWNDAGTERELREVRLAEVSAVTGQPAYSATTAQVRTLDVLADKTGLDAVRMNEAITKLEAGEELSADDAALLDEAISKLRSPDAAASDAANLLLLKKKQLDLAFLAA